MANQVIVGKAMLHRPFRKPIGVNWIGQNPARLLGYLRVPQAIEHVDHVLPAVLLHAHAITKPLRCWSKGQVQKNASHAAVHARLAPCESLNHLAAM